jgi:hypothetical protein
VEDFVAIDREDGVTVHHIPQFFAQAQGVYGSLFRVFEWCNALTPVEIGLPERFDPL